MAEKFRDIIKDIHEKKDNEYRERYVENVTKFVNAARENEWPNELIDSFLKDNQIASVANAGRFYSKDIEKLKGEWGKTISKKLQNIVNDSNKSNFLFYNQFKQDIIGILGRDKAPKSSINRMILSLLPESLTCIASESQLNTVCDFIEGCEDTNISFNDNYFEKSHELYKLILDEVSKIEEKDISWETIGTYAWQLREKIIEIKQYESLLLNTKNLILTGAPGTGKSYLAKEIAKGLVADKSKEDERIEFVQFHPSYDYTDFIEGLRPVKKEAGSIGFERKDGIFMDFCRKALAAFNPYREKYKDDIKKAIKEAPKFVFIIDEINRGEMSKILGELFFSVDPDYRGRKGKVATQYSNLWKYRNDNDEEVIYDDVKFDGDDKFYIPENVYIIGTMNDIDRSVESMDFAMRRRFAFKEVLPSDRMCMIRENVKLKKHYDDIEKRMTALNQAIKKLLGPSYELGASYFLKLENYIKRKPTPYSWEQLWKNHLKGVLFEYFRGLPEDELQEKMKTLESAYKIEKPL